MRIAIHQPEFIPWLGFFDKMKRVDKYIVFDHVQFKKRYFENRNRIKQGNTAVWLSIPVKTKSKYSQNINEVEIDNSSPWQKKSWEKIRYCYLKSQYFKEYSKELEILFLLKKYEKLIDFNMVFIEWFRKILNINTPMVFSSDMNVEGFRASDLILEICLRAGATEYLCGLSGKDYLKLDDFSAAGIEVKFQNFEHPKYEQRGSEFIPYLSMLDMVLNCGFDSQQILFGSSGIRKE